MPPVIALLTDFGSDDIYVGLMKAVALRICPGAQIVDISHAIQPQNLRQAAFNLRNCVEYFPSGTAFCVVVDPGVGSARLPIAVRAGGFHFVAPDNGVLSYALNALPGPRPAVQLQKAKYQLPAPSHTFHGRDIFAPAAARLACEPACFSDLGPQLARIVSLPPPELRVESAAAVGEVAHVDRFGNIITSIGLLRWHGDERLRLEPAWDRATPARSLRARAATVSIGGLGLHGISRAYHEAASGQLLALVGSNGFLEIGANQASATDRLGAGLGDAVLLRWVD